MNSKIASLLCSILFPFLFIACSAQSKPVGESSKNTEDKNLVVQTLTFEGESEHWKAVFIQNIKDREENRKITLTYKGSDLKSVNRVKSSFVYPSGKMTEDGVLSPDGTTVLQGFGNGTHLLKDSVVKATVE